MYYYVAKLLYGLDRATLDARVLALWRNNWRAMVKSPWECSWEGLGGGSRAHCYGMFPGYFLSAYVLGVRRDGPMGPDQRWVEVAPEGGVTSLTLVTWFPTMPAGSIKGTVLETDDLDADVRRLIELGVVIEGGIQDQPWGRFVTFDDPDGNGIVLQATASRD